MIIKDLDGREYKIPNLEEFKNHIKNKISFVIKRFKATERNKEISPII